MTELSKDFMISNIEAKKTTQVLEHSTLPVVFQALPKWDSDYASTSLTIAQLLSKKRAVFYIEHPFSVVDAIKKSNRSSLSKRSGSTSQPFTEFPNFTVIHPPLIFPFNSLPNSTMYNSLMNKYLKKLWKHVDSVLIENQFDSFIYVNSFDPNFGEIQTQLSCKKKIYHCVDWIGGEEYIAKHGLASEEHFVRNLADIVITTSEPLAKRLKKWNSNTTCIPNAADFSHFYGNHVEPDEYKSIPGKKIVYVGNIGLRIDYALIEKTAIEHPEWSFIFVGPKDPTYFKGQELEKLNNVHFLGKRAYKDLPAYMQHADVALIPFEKSTLTEFIYPLKLNEYLATGVPVVSSDFTDLSDFKSAIDSYSSPEEFSQKIQSAIITNSPEKKAHREFIAKLNTWENRMLFWNKYIAD